MEEVDLIIQNAGQVATCSSPAGPKRGPEMQDAGLISDGAIAIRGNEIAAVEERKFIQSNYTARKIIDAQGMAVCPGFVDPHTHVVYASNRVNEFELRIKGTSYLEIMAAGGGIVSTTRAVRSASVNELVDQAWSRLDAMLQLGTTSVEIKTGYGLDAANEMKMLEVIEILASKHPCTIVPTFLGGHAIPSEFKNNPEDYVDLVIEKMIPEAAEWYERSLFKRNKIPFCCDVFIENNAFNFEQSRRIFNAASKAGLGIKIHADEFTSLGGVSLAVEFNALSADHLDATNAEDRAQLAASHTIAVVLPGVNFNLGSSQFANARALIDEGCALALATDFNPGSAPCPSQPLIMAIASRYQKLLPAETLNACTINAAHALGLGDRVGSIEPGKKADLIILKTADYRFLSYEFGGNLVDTVIKNGVVQ